MDDGKKRGGRGGRGAEWLESNSMRGRFGSPIFGRGALSAPSQTLPPRIELSVQISILTANLPANSPSCPVLLSLPPRLFSINDPLPPSLLNTILVPRVFLSARRERCLPALSPESSPHFQLSHSWNLPFRFPSLLAVNGNILVRYCNGCWKRFNALEIPWRVSMGRLLRR